MTEDLDKFAQVTAEWFKELNIILTPEQLEDIKDGVPVVVDIEEQQDD